MEVIITPAEVAVILRIHVRTVYKLAEEGVIPGNRTGRIWRFRKEEILDLVSIKRRPESRLGDSSGHK